MSNENETEMKQFSDPPTGMTLTLVNALGHRVKRESTWKQIANLCKEPEIDFKMLDEIVRNSPDMKYTFLPRNNDDDKDKFQYKLHVPLKNNFFKSFSLKSNIPLIYGTCEKDDD